MAVLFTKGAGQVVRIKPKNGSFTVPFRIDFEDQRKKFIVTQAAMLFEGSYQILHAMDDTIYAYIFGDRITQMRIAGTAFCALCEAGGGGQAGNESGLDEVISYYEKNRLSERATPVKIQFGNKFGKGLITGLNVDITAGDFQLGSFIMQLLLFPKLQKR